MPFIESRERYSQLFTEHHRRVLLAAYRVTGNMADAEDVTQTVFLRLANSNGSPAQNIASYLYRAGINGALDLLRHRQTVVMGPLEDAAHVPDEHCGSSPEANVSARELGGLLRHAISQLSPRAAEMFTLRYLEGLTNPEIANLLRTSQAVVAVTLHQTRSKLKKKLKDSGWETR